MLTVIDVKGNQYVKLSEFYDKMELPKDAYHKYIKRNITNHEIPSKIIDFIQIDDKKHGKGRPRMDFLISFSLLQTLCFQIRTPKSRQVKIWAEEFIHFRMI